MASNIANTLGTATGVWSNGQLVAGEPGNVSTGRSGPRFVSTTGGPVTLPSDFTEEDSKQWVDAYNQYIGTLTTQWQQTSGLQRKQIEAQIEDAKRGQQNAMKIAQLQAETTRYGYDQTRETALATLKEKQLEFDKTHELDLQKFGLDTKKLDESVRQFNVTSGQNAYEFGANMGQRQYEFGVNAGQAQQRLGLDTAEAYTKYASTPDMRWAAADFDSAIARANQGLGPSPIDANPANPNAPQPKTWEQFSVLANYGPNGTGRTMGGAGATDPSGVTGRGVDRNGQQVFAGGPSSFNEGGGTPGSTTDPRITAANAVMKAIPPSTEPGHNDQDWAALNAVRSLYFSGGPGAVERLGEPRRKTALAGLARLGYDPQLVENDRISRGVGQQSVRMA